MEASVDAETLKYFEQAIASEKAQGDGFEPVLEEFGLKVFRKDGGPSGVVIKAFMDFHEISAQDLATCLLEDELRKVWDPNFKHPQVLEQLSETSDVYYFVAEAPFPLSNRDFVNKRFLLKNHQDVDYFSYMTATEHPAKPADGKLVRGKFHQFARIIRQDKSGSGCRLTIIMQTEFGGNVPSMVVNKKASGMPKDTYKNILKHYPQFKKDGLLEKYKR